MVSPVRSLWRAMSSQRRELALAAVLGAIASASAIALLGTSGWLISRAAEMPPVLTLTVAAVMVRFLALSRALFRYAERLVGHDAAFRGLTELRVTVYASLERLAPTGLKAFSRGDLLGRLVADVDAALDLPLRVLLPWMQAVLVTIATVAFMAWLLPAAGWFVGVLGLVALGVTPWIAARVARRADERLAPAKGELTATVVRALDATPEITAFGAATAVSGRVRGLDDEVTRISARESFGLGLGSGLGVLVQGAAVVGALALAVPAVVDGRIEPVWLAVVAFLPLALFDVLAGLPASALSLQRLRGSALRIREVEVTESPISPPASPRRLPALFTGLELSAVSARWQDGPAAIEGMDLRVEPGQRIAIVGPSGAGKSTLAAVLLGFLPYSGSARLSGVELRDVEGDDLRRQVTLLAQQAHIFDTSISDNVRIGDPDASDRDVERAVAQAQLESWIAELPQGLATRVGSFGVAASGGERQRIALARVLLAGRPLVILDEPTEHLDGPTADALAATIDAALRDVTVVTITHRLIGLERADRIVELSDGRISRQGTHVDLIAADGWYAQQWRLETERRDMSVLLPSLPVGRGVPGPVG